MVKQQHVYLVAYPSGVSRVFLRSQLQTQRAGSNQFWEYPNPRRISFFAKDTLAIVYMASWKIL